MGENKLGYEGASAVPTAGANRARRNLFIGIGAGLAIWIFLYIWLQRAADYLSYNIFNLSAASRLGSSVAFFLYDAPKVMMLLGLIVFIIGIIRSFFSPERTRQILAGKREFAGNILAAALGIVTPF